VCDIGEPPLAGATLDLYAGAIDAALAAAPPLATCVTGDDGHCVFSQLLPGEYTLHMTPPAGFGPTSSHLLPCPVCQGETLMISFGAAPLLEPMLHLPLVYRNATSPPQFPWLHLPLIHQAWEDAQHGALSRRWPGRHVPQ